MRANLSGAIDSIHLRPLFANSMFEASRRHLLQAVRMLLRDWRGGELQLLVGALVIAVAAVTSVGFFVERLQAGFERDAAQLLGGDLVVRSDEAFDPEYRQAAQARGLAVTQAIQFPSMAMQVVATLGADPQAQLVGLKAVDEGYPLRGAIRIAEARGAPDHPASGIPAPGTVWIDEQLLGALGVALGDPIQLGDARFQIASLVTLEADRGAGFINLAPRVLMRASDLAATGLLQPGARIGYQLMVAGDASAVSGFRRWLEPRLAHGQRIESVAGGSEAGERPQAQQTLGRAQSFMSLVALMTVMLAAVAVALAARRFVARHIDAWAILRCLGSTSRQITAVFTLEFLMIGLLASLVGALIGFVGHFVLLSWLGQFASIALPAAGPVPALRGVVTGLVMLIGFALPPLLQLRRVSPVRVLRRDLGTPQAPVLLTYGLGLAAFAALLWWFAEDPMLGAVAGIGFVLALGVDALVVYGVLRALGHWRERLARGSVVLRFALAGTARRPASTVVQVVAIAIGLMALLLLTVTRNDLIDGWRGAAAPDAPNRYVLNIQPEQRAAFNAALKRAGLPEAVLWPMVRGRLTAINGQPITPEQFEGRAKRLVEREFNLSYTADAPDHNKIVEGRWFAPSAQEISVEAGLMKTLNLKLGDRLRFEVAGNTVEASITSAREVQWNSMRVNFFVIFPPALLESMQQNFITSFRMPSDHDLGPRLLAEFPNLTIVDTGTLLQQLQRVIDQVISAVQFLFGFAVVAGVLVLYAALAASRDERVREAALLRALGATQAQLSRAAWIEFGLLGLLAGLLAALGASLIGQVAARLVFDFSLGFNPAVFVIGGVAGIVITLLAAVLGLRRVLRQAPMLSLREA